MSVILWFKHWRELPSLLTYYTISQHTWLPGSHFNQMQSLGGTRGEGRPQTPARLIWFLSFLLEAGPAEHRGQAPPWQRVSHGERMWWSKKHPNQLHCLLHWNIYSKHAIFETHLWATWGTSVSLNWRKTMWNESPKLFWGNVLYDCSVCCLGREEGG